MWFDHNQNSLTIQHLQNLQNNATGLYHDWMDRVAQYNVRLKTRQKEGVTSATTRPEHRRPSMCLFSLPSLGFQTFSTYAELFLTKSLYMTTHLLTFLQNIYMLKDYMEREHVVVLTRFYTLVALSARTATLPYLIVSEKELKLTN